LIDLLVEIRLEGLEVGPIVAEVSRALAELGPGLPGGDRARGAAALVLAAQLDAGAGLATAGIAKELRATLTELELAAKERDDADRDPADDFDAELVRLTSG
jgi:hypothetical protein